MDKQSYNKEAHSAKTFQMFSKLRESEKTCDIFIVTSSNIIKAHKMVLASASEFFKYSIYGLFLNDSSKTELKLNGIQYEILLLLVDYMYTGRIDINSENAYDIYKAANYCLMDFVQMRCLEFMAKNINSENCLKIWIIANQQKYKDVKIGVEKMVFSNLEILSYTSEFLNLSNQELLDLLGVWPEDKLCDTIISAAFKWAADKKQWENTLIKIFKNISYTKISNDYLMNDLSNNELLEKSLVCRKWIMSVHKERSELFKFNSFLADQPIIFANYGDDGTNNFYKYNRNDNGLIPFNTIHHAEDCKIYKKCIYVIGPNYCRKFPFDKPNNGCKLVFAHCHGEKVKAAVLNEAMYIFGGNSSNQKGSGIDLNTAERSNFSLLYERENAGVTVNDGSIYICGGEKSNIVEHYDPREGTTSQFSSIPFHDARYTFATALPNQIYCSHIDGCKMIDLRNNETWVEIKLPVDGGGVQCLFSSYGKLYTIIKNTVYEYNDKSNSWDKLESLPNSSGIWLAASFK